MLARNTDINHSQLYQKLVSAHPILLSDREWDAVREFLTVIPWTPENRSDADNPNCILYFQFSEWLPNTNLEISHFLDFIIAKAKAQNKPEIASLATNKAQEFMKQILIERQLADSLESDDEEEKEEDSDSEAPKPRRRERVYSTDELAQAAAELAQADTLATKILNYFPYGSHTFSHQVQTLQKIGAGGFGKIYRTRTLSNPNIESIVKHLPGVKNKEILTEVAIMMACKSPYVMRCMGLQIGETTIKIMMEEATGGSLLDFLRSAHLDIAAKTDLSLKIALGLLQVHEMNFIHSDVKPGNILIAYNSTTKEITPKISDFGSAHSIATENPTFISTFIRTDLAYCAPEILEQFSPVRDLAITYTAKVDPYGLALTFFEIYTGQEPLSCEIYEENFYSEEPKNYVLNNYDRYRKHDEEVMKRSLGASPILKEIIELGRERDPHQRPDIKTIVRMLVGAKKEHQEHIREVNNLFGAQKPMEVPHEPITVLTQDQILAEAREYIALNLQAILEDEVLERPDTGLKTIEENVIYAPTPKRARTNTELDPPK